MRMEEDVIGINRLLSGFSLTGGVVSDFEKCILKIIILILFLTLINKKKLTLAILSTQQ